MGFLEDQRRIEQQRAKQLLANRKKRLRAAKGSDSAQRAEHRFAQQAEVARYRRLANAQSMDAVKEISPDGGYWLLDVTAKTHTKGCLKMAGFNWPWHVLDRVHPLRHHGCRCAILPASDAASWGDGRVARHVMMEGEPAVVHDDQQLGSWFTNAGETRWQ